MTTLTFDEVLINARQRLRNQQAELIARLASDLASKPAVPENANEAWATMERLRDEFARLPRGEGMLAGQLPRPRRTPSSAGRTARCTPLMPTCSIATRTTAIRRMVCVIRCWSGSILPSSIIVPAIILAEISGPISRFYCDPVRARLYADSVAALPHLTLIAVDAALAHTAAELAADYALRGMDALYVAVARQYRCPLVTLDTEIRQRASTIITVQTPLKHWPCSRRLDGCITLPRVTYPPNYPTG